MDPGNVMIIVLAVIAIIVISLTVFATIIKIGLTILVVGIAFELLDPTSTFLGTGVPGPLTRWHHDPNAPPKPKPKKLHFEHFDNGADAAYTPLEGESLKKAVREEQTDLLSQDDVMGEFNNKSTIYPIFSFTKGMAFPDTEAVIPFAAKDFDDRSALLQKHVGNKNRDAIAGMVSATRNVYDRYIRGELDENEKRVWYSSEANMESDFFPAY